MSSVSIDPQKRKGVWTIRRLLAAASDETPPRRPPRAAAPRKQAAQPMPAAHRPPRRAPVAAPDCDWPQEEFTWPQEEFAWPQEEFTWPHEEFAVIADNEPAPKAQGSGGEQQSWGMPMLDWGEESAAPPSPRTVSRQAARPRTRPEAAPPRSFHPLPVQGAVPHPAQQPTQEASQRQYREALAEALQRELLPEAARPVASRQTAKARASKATPMRDRASPTNAEREKAMAAARREEAEARARQQDLARIRRQQAALRERFRYALAELRYEAPPPPLLPRAPAAGPGEAQQPAPPPSPSRQESVPPNIVAVAIRTVKRAAIAAALFSVFVNLLMLAGPLFMMGAYEFAPESLPTLLALSVLLAMLYGALALLDRLRGRIVKRAAGRIDAQFGPAMCDALRHRLATARGIPNGPLRDIVSLRQFMSGAGPAAFLDLPWAPIALSIITMMHWSLGLITGIGMLVVVAVAVASQAGTRALLREARQANEDATRLALEMRHDIATATAMETSDPIGIRWRKAKRRADIAMRRAGDRAAAFASTATIVRRVVQTALLGAGGLLLTAQEISLGMMIAVSVISGKAIRPIGEAVSGWRGLIGARDALRRLEALHRRYPAERKRLMLPEPKGRIEVRDLRVTPPDTETAVIQQVGFALKAGEALGVLCASAAGKAALARVLAGLDTPNCGWARLDGSDLRMLDSDELGRKVGYLPQTVELREGAVGENIARFDPNATRDAIVQAAKTAGIHDMIAGLPGGYDFNVGEDGLRLSAAQRQLLGLARAVFGEPVLVVLEEPANLDALGKAALRRTVTALKASRTTAVLVTHRLDALDPVDHILVLEQGKPRAFGRKSKIIETLGRKEGNPASAPAVAARPRTAQPPRTAKVAPAPKAARRA